MEILTQKGLSYFVAHQVEKHDATIEQAVKSYLEKTPGTEFCDSKPDAERIFGTNKVHSDKAAEFTVKIESVVYLVTVWHYQAPIVSTRQLYSILIEKL